MEKKYNLYLSSVDKISGNNNNANFNINWSFLPTEIKEFDIQFLFISAGGLFVDNASVNPILYNTTIKITSNLIGNRNYNFDINQAYNTLGYASLDQAYVLGSAVNTASTIAKGNSYKCIMNENPKKRIVRPSGSQLNIIIQNLSALLNNQSVNNSLTNFQQLECNTSYTYSADFPNWIMVIEFYPVKD